METDLPLAQLGAGIGEPARARMLLALMDGRSRTAKELAYLAAVTPPTASVHLARLVDLGLLSVMSAGRNRFFRLASPAIARMLETMGAVAAGGAPTRTLKPPGTAALRLARTCYDHLAGRLGVAIADAMHGSGHLHLTEEDAEVTPSGFAFLRGIGLDLPEPRRATRIQCRPCLDWTERRPHLAGAVGTALCRHCLEAGWVARQRDGRALTVTREGHEAFERLFGITLDEPAATRAA
ncbi:MAG TPA: helix-turn-helix transcriptional regulator [Microvirga sp.]|jgi:DNA-binding transcriptional ArsR family regulator